jgi:hypothetical protein
VFFQRKAEGHIMATVDFQPGGYRYIPAGFAIERVRLPAFLPMAEGFAWIERYITGSGRPLTAFCACELRSPAPWNDAGFRSFNETYVVTLEKWGIYSAGTNPVARSNVCPEIDPPKEPGFHAFSFTVPSPGERPTFVIAGGAESRSGDGPYDARTIRHGETSPDAMREKGRFVLDEMAQRLGEFGFGWADTTATQVYTVHDLFPFFGDEIVRRGAARSGLTWHLCRPPVRDLDYEMDCRAIATERAI